MLTISFQAKPFKIGSWTILKLPRDASEKLPSRGMVMVKGTINGSSFQTPLEPDGKGGHWFRLDQTVLKGVKAGALQDLEIEPSKEWREPEVPKDLKSALAESPKAQALWKNITPMARWEWIRG